MKYIILCADDYGMNEDISQSIVRLLAMKRLTAVSCMTTFPDWPHYASGLHPYYEHADMGLHFNLTEGQALTRKGSTIIRQGSFLSLPLLMAKAHARCIKVADVEQELLLQLEQFNKHMKRLPDFIDGHQHIHHLPVIREALLKVYEQHLGVQRPYIRVSVQWWGGGIKSKIIALTGAMALRRQLKLRKIPYNHTFSGIYPFQNAINYRKYFKNFLARAENQELIMCHPALGSSQIKDEIATSRLKEWDYFSSVQFTKDCEHYRIQLGRMHIGN
jgi:predicted glycoside hydrolase/deacetylase ChbG (UPF0249 family)